MSLDLNAIQVDVADVLRTIPDFTAVDDYENRNRDLAEMPFVQVWSDDMNQPQTQPQFGSFGYLLIFRIRAWLPLGDDRTSQIQANVIKVKIREAFDTRPGLIANTAFRANVTSIVQDGFPDSEIPFLLLEGALEVEAKAAPG